MAPTTVPAAVEEPLCFTRFPIASLSLWPLLVSAYSYCIPRTLLCLKNTYGFTIDLAVRSCQQVLAQVVVAALVIPTMVGNLRLFSVLQTMSLCLEWEGLEVLQAQLGGQDCLQLEVKSYPVTQKP